MTCARISLATAALLLSSGFALAQQPLDDLDADRINPNQIMIEFEYQGGACEQVGPAELGDIVDGTLSVTFTATSTAEVCTMQVVEIEVEQAIEADSAVTHVDVTLLGGDGQVIATGRAKVDLD